MDRTRTLCRYRTPSLPLAAFAVAVALLLSPRPAQAVTPTTVEQVNESDFAGGELGGTALSSSGQIRLGRELTILLHSEKAPTVVSALAVAGKVVYAGSGKDGTIYRIEGSSGAKFASTGGTMIGSLLWTGKELLAGVNGPQGAGVWRIDDKGKAQRIWSDNDVKYVWAMQADKAGAIYLATGPKAQVFAIDRTGKGQKLFQAPGDLARNVLCLAAGSDSTIYAGTDRRGLVFAIDLQNKTSRVVLDAPEKEISALASDGGGGLYVGANESSKTSIETPLGVDETQEHPLRLSPANIPSEGSGEADDAGTSSDVAAPGPSHVSVRTPSSPSDDSETETPAAAEPSGNAVYYIASDGLVRTILRRPVFIHSLLKQGPQLFLGTGNNGQVYAVGLDQAREVTMVADVEASQVTCLAAGDDGVILLGTSNKGSVGRLGASCARRGTFVSKPIDAQQIAKWGTICLDATVPQGAGIEVSTRTGNLAEPADRTWSPWSDPAPAGEEFIKIASPAGRYLQYRLSLKTDGQVSPAAADVKVVYQVANLAPEIPAIRIVASGGSAMSAAGGDSESASPASPPSPAGASAAQQPAPQPLRTIMFRATDPNGDQLLYTVEYRQVGSETWIKIADKLERPQYVWDTRTVADGRYQLRVTASDSPSNPPGSDLSASRVSNPVVVDNTAPVVKDLLAKADVAKVSAGGTVVDNISRIASIHYSLDSATEWVAVLPADGICDSNKESFAFEIKDAKPGAHRLTVRVTDSAGNSGYSSISLHLAK